MKASSESGLCATVMVSEEATAGFYGGRSRSTPSAVSEVRRSEVGSGAPNRVGRLTCGAPEARIVRKRVCKDFLLYLDEGNF